MSRTKPIPAPPTDPLIGHLRLLDGRTPIQGLMRLAAQYGPIFRLELPGRNVLILSARDLVAEVCDETRFRKRIHAPLQEIRAFAGDGLFTAHPEEPNWAVAHRLLMPAFGPLGIRSMFEPMLDIADQMLLRWERFGSETAIDVGDQMTRLTLDTIALCAFSERFNSFYSDRMHPFIGAMVDALAESGARARRPAAANRLLLIAQQRYERNIALMHRVADELIARRRRDPEAAHKKDLLNLMLLGTDPVTGQRLSDENIRYQLVTFLIAGHETTSGLLTFALWFLLQHPEVLARARQEVDEAIGERAPTLDDLPRTRFLEQVLMETLRIWPTAPAFALEPLHDTVLGGQWAVRTTDYVMVLIPALHRDPAVWSDPEIFRPERFSPESAAQHPPHAWKPFGNGARACIGRPFAMQEAHLLLAMMLQRFDLVGADPGYTLKVHETITLKPEGFRIRVKRRGGGRFRAPSSVSTQVRSAAPAHAPTEHLLPDGVGTPLLVLYGSGSGSSQAFAERIAAEAAPHGFNAQCAALDEWASGLPDTGAVVIVTASYEGQPPENARQFCTWLPTCTPGTLSDVRYAVFGCGNRQWARTWQAVPMFIDEGLAAAGATRLVPRGESDSGGDFFGPFDAWLETLWPALATAFGQELVETGAEPLVVEPARDARRALLRLAELGRGTVVENRELVDLTRPGARSRRHIEIALPDDMDYRAGDYLVLLPNNPPGQVRRALRRFGLAIDETVVLRQGGVVRASLPLDVPIAVGQILSEYVELGQPATRRQLEALIAATPCPPDQQALRALLADHEAQVLAVRRSVLDLLEQTPSCTLTFAAFLDMMPPLRARQYSISSSPLWNGRHCTLTVAVVDGPHQSGQGRFQGTASSLLAVAEPGTRLAVAVRPSGAHFHPPADPALPMIMVCAGSGIAPFRGFLQERAEQQAAGRTVGSSLLFFGCQDEHTDWLYRDELAAWQARGLVDVRTAFSRTAANGIRHVQDRVWQDRADVEALFRAGATVYVCGDGRHMAPAVRGTFVRIYRDVSGADEAAAESWADHLERQTGRYVADVFA